MNPERKIATRWIVAYALAEIVGIAWPATPGLPAFPGDLVLWAGLRGGVAFGLMGLIQGFALKEARRDVFVPAFAFWTAVAGAFACAAIVAVVQGMDEDQINTLFPIGPLGLALLGTGLGTATGLAQLIPLRAVLTRRWAWPFVWALACAVGYSLEELVLAAADNHENGQSQFMVGVAAGVLVTLVIGGITGIAAVMFTKAGDTHEPTRAATSNGEGHRG